MVFSIELNGPVPMIEHRNISWNISWSWLGHLLHAVPASPEEFWDFLMSDNSATGIAASMRPYHSTDEDQKEAKPHHTQVVFGKIYQFICVVFTEVMQ